MRPGHYRVVSTPQNCFWCCVGTGLENHAKYGELVYTTEDDDLFVNLFIASRLSLPEQNLVLEQTGTAPYDDEVRLVRPRGSRQPRGYPPTRPQLARRDTAGPYQRRAARGGTRPAHHAPRNRRNSP